MSKYTSQVLTDQIILLSHKLTGPFPYEDCRHLLAQLCDTVNVQDIKRFEDLIQDLDAYFYLVDSHSGGATKLMDWSASELIISQTLLKNSFFQTHTRYREIAWMINEINTPQLHVMLTVSNELRVMLQKLIFDLVEESKRANIARQQEFLLA